MLFQFFCTLFCTFYLSILPSVSALNLCPSRCRIRFCSIRPAQGGTTAKRPIGTLRKFWENGERSPGVLCHQRLLRNVVLGEAQVMLQHGNSSLKPISLSKYGPEGLDPPFPQDFLKIKTIISDFDGLLQVITRRSHGNQDVFFNDLCIRVPIIQYQERETDGSLGPIVKSSRNSDCVAFKAKTARLAVQLVWYSTDDLDLALIEPSGNKISRFNRRSSSRGIHVFDSGSENVCLPRSKNIRNREGVWYNSPTPLIDGKYTAIVEHYRNCKEGPTNYEVQLIMAGAIIRSISGVANKNHRNIVEEYSFELRNNTIL